MYIKLSAKPPYWTFLEPCQHPAPGLICLHFQNLLLGLEEETPRVLLFRPDTPGVEINELLNSKSCVTSKWKWRSDVNGFNSVANLLRHRLVLKLLLLFLRCRSTLHSLCINDKEIPNREISDTMILQKRRVLWFLWKYVKTDIGIKYHKIIEQTEEKKWPLVSSTPVSCSQRWGQSTNRSGQLQSPEAMQFEIPEHCRTCMEIKGMIQKMIFKNHCKQYVYIYIYMNSKKYVKSKKYQNVTGWCTTKTHSNATRKVRP